jgi:DNA/RNA endonuclease YhcR with UshA esterase domain
MRLLIGTLTLLLLPALTAADEKAKPITPTEAAKRIGQKCVVEMKVESTGKSARSGVFFLNSEVKYQDPKNFTIFISKAAAEKFKKAKVDDPATHFKGKTVRVTGTVKLYRERPEIAVEEPDQVEIVEQKKNP